MTLGLSRKERGRATIMVGRVGLYLVGPTCKMGPLPGKLLSQLSISKTRVRLLLYTIESKIKNLQKCDDTGDNDEFKKSKHNKAQEKPKLHKNPNPNAQPLHCRIPPARDGERKSSPLGDGRNLLY